MTARYMTRIRPTYVSICAINIGARAVRENGMSTGRVTVLYGGYTKKWSRDECKMILEKL